MIKAAYTGTFDPFTKGHSDILRRASGIFDEVLVGVLNNANKNSMFTISERVDIVEHYFIDLPENISVKGYDGTSFNFVAENNANVIIRGIRGTLDLDMEMQYAIMNKKYAGLETILLFSDLEKSIISSTLIKTLFKSGVNILEFVNEYTYLKMKEKLQ